MHGIFFNFRGSKSGFWTPEVPFVGALPFEPIRKRPCKEARRLAHKWEAMSEKLTRSVLTKRLILDSGIQNYRIYPGVY